MPSHPLIELTRAKVRELLREPEALFWVFAFPILLAAALGLAFRSAGPPQLGVAVQDGPDAAWFAEALARAPAVRVETLAPERAQAALRTGRVALVVIPGDPWTYWFDPTRPESRLAQLETDAALQSAAGRLPAHATAVRELSERGSRYIDFLVPGLLGMNLMGTGVWGVGFYIVSARSRKLLKRLIAAPMRRSEYLAAQIGGRLLFLIPEVLALLAFARLVFDVPLRGSWAAFALICLAGAVTFSGLGLLVASRARTIEGVSGLMNVVLLPMWIFSGTFFSTARFPDWLQPAIQALPLTALNDGLRAVMLEGASLVAVAGELAIVAAWGVATFAVALWLFRWS